MQMWTNIQKHLEKLAISHGKTMGTFSKMWLQWQIWVAWRYALEFLLKICLSATSPMEQLSSWSLHTFIFFRVFFFSFHWFPLYHSLCCLVWDKQRCKKKYMLVTFLQTVFLHLSLAIWMSCSDNFCQCMLPSVLNFSLFESAYWQLAHVVKME